MPCSAALYLGHYRKNAFVNGVTDFHRCSLRRLGLRLLRALGSSCRFSSACQSAGLALSFLQPVLFVCRLGPHFEGIQLDCFSLAVEHVPDALFLALQ